jgi:uncharacterized protein YdhG (YjbR/CyaY superfamily)
MDTKIQAYFDAVPASRKVIIEKLHSLVMQNFPDAALDMQYSMPTYKYGGGWVALANQKAYVSLYTCSAAHLASFRKRHPQIKTGKGCINFRERDEIPEQDVAQVIRHAMLQPKAESPHR